MNNDTFTKKLFEKMFSNSIESIKKRMNNFDSNYKNDFTLKNYITTSFPFVFNKTKEYSISNVLKSFINILPQNIKDKDLFDDNYQFEVSSFIPRNYILTLLHNFNLNDIFILSTNKTTNHIDKFLLSTEKDGIYQIKLILSTPIQYDAEIQEEKTYWKRFKNKFKNVSAINYIKPKTDIENIEDYLIENDSTFTSDTKTQLSKRLYFKTNKYGQYRRTWLYDFSFINKDNIKKYINFYDNKYILNNIIQSNNFLQKYLKYKNKYLQLKYKINSK
jgi:hypothetical protein